MKRSWLTVFLGGLGIMLGLESCKKDCIECFTYIYSYYNQKIRVCEDQFISDDIYEEYRDDAKAQNPTGFDEEILCEK